MRPTNTVIAVSEPEESEPISRKGYALKDLARSFLMAMSESGPIASGRLLHYTADMIGSGGLDLWQRLCWEYAFDHIGIASPRIFTYLRKKLADLAEANTRLPFTTFVNSPEIQKATAEVVLILQSCPKKAKAKMPIVPQDTHTNRDWIRTITRATEKAAVMKVWSHSSDLPELMYASNEIITAITDGALERALFWTRWAIEEDNLLRKTYGSGLSTMERGPAVMAPKQRTYVGYFICCILAEAYKEFAEKQQIRMHEEFQTLLDLYRSNTKILTPTRRQDCLNLMIHILTDVPRWKVPAAPTLIKDPVVLSRAVEQSAVFYREILSLPLPKRPLPTKTGSLAVKKKKNVDKQELLESHLDSVNDAIMSFYKF